MQATPVGNPGHHRPFRYDLQRDPHGLPEAHREGVVLNHPDGARHYRKSARNFAAMLSGHPHID
jgi:hypothetical protein